MTALGDFSAGDVLTAADLNALNNVTALELTAAFNIPTGAPTNITFGAGTEIVDVSGWHSTSTNTERITPTIQGIYLVTCFMRWNETALNDYGVSIQKNSTTIAEVILEGDYYPAGTAATIVSMNGTTDYVKLVGFTTSGITRQIFRAGLSLMLLRGT
jgi:hypothetical protein